MCSVKPRNDLSDKGRAVEEWLDLRFFRPVGIRIARALYPTGISPDQVTLWSLLIGLVAGHLFVYRDRWIDVIGFVLFIVSDIFDSADGQLARLRGSSTRFGRALDGISDNLRFVNLYFHLIYRLIHAGFWGPGAFLLVAAAGLAHTFQSAAIDFVRNAFLYIGVGNGGELDLPEDLAGGPQTTVLQRFGARVYRDYVQRQSHLFPRTVKLIRLLRRHGVTDDFRAEYRARQEVVLPLCAWLGQNIRFVLLGVAAVAAHISAFLWAEAVWMSLVLVALLWIHEWNATALGDLLDGERNAYARPDDGPPVPRASVTSPRTPRRRRAARSRRGGRAGGQRRQCAARRLDPVARPTRPAPRPGPARFHRHLHADRFSPGAHAVGARAGLSRGVREAGGAHARRGGADRRRRTGQRAHRDAVSSIPPQSGMDEGQGMARERGNRSLALGRVLGLPHHGGPRARGGRDAVAGDERSRPGRRVVGPRHASRLPAARHRRHAGERERVDRPPAPRPLRGGRHGVVAVRLSRSTGHHVLHVGRASPREPDSVRGRRGRDRVDGW